MDDIFNSTDVDASEIKSKSQMKREMEALQSLGERLTELNDKQLELVPLEDRLLNAITEYRRLRKNEARRRQRQFIGKLMRDTDAEAIVEVLERFDASRTAHTQHFHKLEQWRKRLLDESQALTQFLDEYPQVDIQHLRQLVRNTQKEKRHNQDGGAGRKLFRYLREVTE